MADSYRVELRDLIERVYVDEHAAQATAQMVHLSVHRDLPDHLLDYLVGRGLKSEIQAFFRAKNSDGLPRFPEVNEGGEHRQLELLSINEFAFVHRQYLGRSDANLSQAEKLRQLCVDVHGVDLVETRAAS